MSFDISRDERGGYAVMRDGHPQSYVDLEDPGLLTFEYVQHMAMALDVLAPGRLRVTHVGGAGLSLPRYVEHTRPGSAQIVLEPDVELTAAVRKKVPLPRRHAIRVRAIDGLAGVSALRDASADVIVVDAFEGGRVPGELLGSAFTEQVSRVLVPGGLLALNTCDEPGLQHARAVVATLAAVFPQVGLIALNEVLNRRRFGNLVVLASHQTLHESALLRRAASAAFPTKFLGTTATARWLGGARAFGPTGIRSPVPPDGESWLRI
ncbi:MAG: fused MFS/spermidine synthase [Ornithinimicrobium sp.]